MIRQNFDKLKQKTILHNNRAKFFLPWGKEVYNSVKKFVDVPNNYDRVINKGFDVVDKITGIVDTITN